MLWSRLLLDAAQKQQLQLNRSNDFWWLYKSRKNRGFITLLDIGRHHFQTYRNKKDTENRVLSREKTEKKVVKLFPNCLLEQGLQENGILVKKISSFPNNKDCSNKLTSTEKLGKNKLLDLSAGNCDKAEVTQIDRKWNPFKIRENSLWNRRKIGVTTQITACRLRFW